MKQAVSVLELVETSVIDTGYSYLGAKNGLSNRVSTNTMR